MAISHVLFGLLSFVFALHSSAAPFENRTCTTPAIRKEWRSLSIPERKSYIRAVRCLQELPSKATKYFSQNKNRYDDFVSLHANATAGGSITLDGFKGFEELAKNPFAMVKSMQTGIHGTGPFLPWHRYAINAYEEALRSECGYTGSQPYWDWYLDTPEAGGDFNKSPLFDPDHGFGGNGAYVNMSGMPLPGGLSLPALEQLAKLIPGFELPDFGGTGGGCLLDGPFKNLTLTIGPMGQMTPNNTRCLTRGFNSKAAHMSASKKSMSKILSAPTFTQLRSWMEGGSAHFTMGTDGLGFANDGGELHNIGHGGVGGEMMDPFNSVNDPLFWMHHSGMDRMWALWQEQDPSRIFDVGTKTWLLDMAALKLDTPVWLGTEGPERPTLQLMDTQNRDGRGILCYKYEGLSASAYDVSPKPSA